MLLEWCVRWVKALLKLDFRLSPTRDAQAAKHFFFQTLTASHTSEQRVINVNKNAEYPKAFAELKVEGLFPENCELRPVKYLNNLIEQDHRFIKRLTKPGMGLLFFAGRMESFTRVRGDEYASQRTDERSE
jgi:transposase-like protein